MENFEIMYMVSYSDIYGKEADKEYLETLVSEIPSLSALEWISNIYYVTTQLKVGENEFSLINNRIIPELDNETRNSLIYYLSNIDISRYRFIDGKAIFLLMNKILENNNRQTFRMSKTQAANLLKAYLICCDLRLSNNIQDDPHSMDNVENSLKVYIPEQLKFYEFELIKDYRIELIRFYEFMRFCENSGKYKSYIELFLSTRHCQSWSKYLFEIFYVFINAAIGSLTPTNKFKTENQVQVKFIETLCINDVEYKPSDDFSLIRKYPVLKIATNTYSILNMNFFLDKMFQGFLFDFAAVLESNHLGNFSTLKSEIGEIFTEHHLFYSAIRGCFHNQCKVMLSGEEIKKTIKNHEPDFYIRKGNRVFLFEFKDITIKSEVKYSGDFEKIKKGLFEQLISSQYNKGKKREIPKSKGVKQIFDTINGKLLDIISQCDNIENLSNLQVYPILVYQDPCLDIEGINYLLNNEFKKMINTMENPHGFRIKDLTMIPLSLLYELEDYFCNNKIKLTLAINEYICQKNINSKYEIRPFSKYVLEKVSKNGYHNEKTKRFQKYIETLKEGEKELTRNGS